MQKYSLYARMLSQPHLLIAGATGSGKSVLENNLIYTALQQGPDRIQFVFIDPKKVNLAKFAALPHCIAHADNKRDILTALEWIRCEMDRRFQDMKAAKIEDYDGPHIYVFVDELMDIITTYPKAARDNIQYIAQVGRAARVHCIVCTQSPIRQILPTSIKCNFDARIALRTRSAQDSRNILDFNGAEKLPRFGKGIYFDPDTPPAVYNIPMIPTDEIQRVIRLWTG